MSKSSIDVDLQILSSSLSIPENSLIEACVKKVIKRNHIASFTNICVRIVDEYEASLLNKKYRGIDKPTNVLAFPVENLEIPGNEEIFLGDIVICGPVVEREAENQNKDVNGHWLHILIHGTLHLLGFSHENESQAREMEFLEKCFLSEYGVSDPYKN